MERTRFSSKTYYLKNKDNWKNKYVKHIDCEICQKRVKQDHYNSHHIKTKKHITLLQLKQKNEQDMVDETK